MLKLFSEGRLEADLTHFVVISSIPFIPFDRFSLRFGSPERRFTDATMKGSI